MELTDNIELSKQELASDLKALAERITLLDIAHFREILFDASDFVGEYPSWDDAPTKQEERLGVLEDVLIEACKAIVVANRNIRFIQKLTTKGPQLGEDSILNEYYKGDDDSIEF